MRMFVACIALVAVLGFPARAATRTVTFSVPDMTCATCPLTVKAALRKVDGVIEVQVSWEPKEAVVIYDDARTDVQALTEAIRDAGYPATAERQP